MQNQSLPLQEIISRIAVPAQYTTDRLPIWAGLGTMPRLNKRWANQPGLDFINYNLRGIGQVIFVNNPLSGLLILLALFIQSPWVGLMSLVGVVSSTVTAIALQLDRDTIRSGIFGYNGILVGAALGTFGLSGNGGWNLWWAVAVIIFSALTTVMMKFFGVWWATTFRCSPLTLPFNIATLLFLSLVMFLPQTLFQLGETTIAETPVPSVEVTRLLASLPIGFGQVFLADKLIAGILVLLAVAICTPLGAIVGLVGGFLGILAGLILGIVPEDLYAGLWGYNSVLSAMAIGGFFYAPTLRSFLVGAVCAFFSALIVPVLAFIFTQPFGLPVLTLPFCVATIACFALLRGSLSSLVPVALYAMTSPEEHRYRYLVARKTISNFRRQLEAAINGKSGDLLFNKTSDATKGDLRYVFDAIDTDRNGELSARELADYFIQADRTTSEDELSYLFNCMDRDNSGTIDFEEFGELILRHQRLMKEYDAFTTYFVPIDADENDFISIEEMNVAMTSVAESPLTREEIDLLQQRANSRSFTWNQFIELLLLT